jgi:hypothetical protein
MKKQLCMIFGVCLTYTATAQTQLPVIDTGNAYTTQNPSYRSWERIGDNLAYQPYSHQFIGVHWWGDAFERSEGQENFTTGNGNGSIHLGTAEASPVHLTLKHNLRGRLYFMTNQLGFGNEITVDASLDPESTITGNTSDRENLSADDNAVTTFNWHPDSRNNNVVMTLIEGVYQGGSGYSGLVNTRNDGDLTIRGASFLAGAVEFGDENDVRNKIQEVAEIGLEPYPKYAAQSGAYIGIAGDLLIDNTNGDGFERYQGASLNSMSINAGGNQNVNFNASGGDGLYAEANNIEIIGGGEFIASKAATDRQVNYTGFDTVKANVNARGGRGLAGSGKMVIEDIEAYGGNAPRLTVGGINATANAMGGDGIAFISDDGTLSGVLAVAGKAGSASIVPEGYWKFSVGSNAVEQTASSENGTAYANGGSGMRLSGENFTISDSTAIGSAGGVANAHGANSKAFATGGHGILGQNATLNILSGSYTGSKGGSVNVNGAGEANGGAGVYANGGTINIIGGTFEGGEAGYVNGVLQTGNMAIWSEGAHVNLNPENSPIINGGIYFANEGKALKALGGTINGDILFVGSGNSSLEISSASTNNGAVILKGGTLNVSIKDSGAPAFLNEVDITGTLSFQNDFTTANGSRFVLNGTNSTIEAKRLIVSPGSTIEAGWSDVTTASHLVMGPSSSMSFYRDFQGGSSGYLDVTGDLVLTNESAKLSFSGIAANPEGITQVAEANNVVTNGADINKIVDADFGWLTKVKGIDTAGGLTIEHEYRSLSESSLSDLDTDLLAAYDSALTNNSAAFFETNGAGEERGTRGIRYSASQLPDVADAAFQASQAVADQLASRSTNFRAMNGFASTKPGLGNTATPMGVAGPDADTEKTMQGWIRGYGIRGDRGRDGNFSSYEADSYGTIVGIDKSFGNLLIGLAGGYGNTEVEGEDTYKTDTDTYHGSIYSTIGGETVYLDLAFSYAQMETDEESLSTDGSFDSEAISVYIGGGKVFKCSDRYTITPVASLLLSFYDQDAYIRNEKILNDQQAVHDYDEGSYLGTLGANLSSIHTIDLFNQGVALSPELRLHWLHEFNDELDNGSYTLVNNPGIGDQTLFARAREEDLFRIGVGFDIWHWRYENAKFEVDYDGLFSSDYDQHTVSGKIAVQF